MENENKAKRLANNFQKEYFKETQLKEKKNKVFSEITNQTRNNEFENDEQNLQIQYYRTIIEQKKCLLEEMIKEKRDKKMAEEAKNNSADMQEVESRKVLYLLKLYNIYLESEIQNTLRKNE